MRSGKRPATTGDYFEKSRPYWCLSSYRLLREARCALFARRMVPAHVNGFELVFPQPETRLGRSVRVRSPRAPGLSLLEMLYREESRGTSVEVGLAVLEALHTPSPITDPFSTFERAYRWLKGPRIVLVERIRLASVLSPAQCMELARLLRTYVLVPPRNRVIVHGDLQPSHLLLDGSTRTVSVLDLEALHLGKPATNLGQLLTGYFYADVRLGCELYLAYRSRRPEDFDGQFDEDLRAAIALRSYRHVEVAYARGQSELAAKARSMLDAVLSGATFEESCVRGNACT